MPWIKGVHHSESPTKEEFLRGCEEFEKHEKRDSMYKVATFLVEHFWGKPADMADALGVLLLTWNQAFYRYGLFDFDELEKCIADNLLKVDSFRKRELTTLSDSDEKEIQELFQRFLGALKIGSGKKSPVAAAKALHLLAPAFFPLWDDKIARAYGCYYAEEPAQKYITFCRITRDIAKNVKNYVADSRKTLVKLIDVYNYSKYTQGWI